MNFIYFNFIEPLLNRINNQNDAKLLAKFNLKDFNTTVISYEEADRKGDLGWGYCCEDCDGCYSQYKRNRYYHDYERHNEEKAKKLFITYLNSLKTGRWMLAPIQLS